MGDCGPTPGGPNCGEATYVLSRWGGVREDKSWVWRQVIGVPEQDGPCVDKAVPCASPEGSSENLIAESPFFFVNSYSNQTIRFSERAAKDEPCGTVPCENLTVDVGPGESTTIPASTLGYYYVETVEGVRVEEFEFPPFAHPPFESALARFRVEVSP